MICEGVGGGTGYFCPQCNRPSKAHIVTHVSGVNYTMSDYCDNCKPVWTITQATQVKLNGVVTQGEPEVYEPIIIKKTIDSYLCPICKMQTDHKDEIQKHLSGHKYKDLKSQVRWMGNSAKFATEEVATEFLDFRMRDWRKNSDVDDDYSLEFKWEGPGEYFESSHTERSEYDGSSSTTVLWKKSLS